MFTTIIIDTREITEDLFKQLSAVLSLHNIACIGDTLTESTLLQICEKLQLPKDELLIISSSPSILKTANDNQFWNLGYCPNMQFLPSKFCFEDIEAIDYAYLKQLWCRFHDLPYQIITTKHLCIRELASEDIPALFSLYQEAEIKRYMASEPEDLISFTEKYTAYIQHVYSFYEYGMWGVFFKENKQLIGLCGFHAEELDCKDEITIGYMLSNHYTRRGLGKEMVGAVLRYGVRHFEFDRILAKISCENLPSQALAKTCQFHLIKHCSCDNSSYQLYEYLPARTYKSATEQSASEKAYSTYQKKPDTRVYGKRYQKR